MYFGKPTLTTRVIDEKLKFFERWPHRTYRLSSKDMLVRCQGLVCDISGPVEWWVGSPKRKAWNRGTAKYQFEVVFTDSGQPFIRLENSSNDVGRWFYSLQTCAACEVTKVRLDNREECERLRETHLDEGLKTSHACFDDEDHPLDAVLQIYKNDSWERHPDPIIQDCLERVGTSNECKG
jgi:hypothetical protein